MKKERRRMPVRTRTVQLDGEWEGWEVTVRTSIPFGRYANALKGILSLPKITEASLETMSPEDKEALSIAPMAWCELVEMLATSWNYVDEEGKPIPCNRKGIDSLPFSLILATFSAGRRAVEESPFRGNS